LPVTIAERSKACTVFVHSEAGIVGLSPTQGMDVWYVYVFILCFVLCLGRDFAMSWSPVQGVLPSVNWSWNWKSESRAQGGCRASEKNYWFSVKSLAPNCFFLKNISLYEAQTFVFYVHKCPPPVRTHPQSTQLGLRSLISIPALSFHPRIRVPSDLFRCGFPIKTLYTFHAFICFWHVLHTSYLLIFSI
jgi:hypothetical protein